MLSLSIDCQKMSSFNPHQLFTALESSLSGRPATAAPPTPDWQPSMPRPSLRTFSQSNTVHLRTAPCASAIHLPPIDPRNPDWTNSDSWRRSGSIAPELDWLNLSELTDGLHYRRSSIDQVPPATVSSLPSIAQVDAARRASWAAKPFWPGPVCSCQFAVESTPRCRHADG